MKNVLAISGSTRIDSSNWRILEFIKEHYKNQLNIEIYNDLDKLPHFDPNIKEIDEIPLIVKSYFKKIESADGIIICTPEYVFSPPAILKNALEWTVSETLFSNKPTALIVASGLGEKTFESLDLILKTLIQEEIPKSSKLLIQGARSKINNEGTFLDEKASTDIQTVIYSLICTLENDKSVPNNLRSK